MGGTSAAVGHTRRRFARLRAVIWDMDGTLIDSADVVPDAFIATAQARSGRTYTRQQIIDPYHLGPPPSMLPRLLGRAATKADLDDYHSRLHMMVHRVRPYPGIAALLRALHPRLPMAVFTGASSRAARLLLEETGLLDAFAVVVAGDEVARQKPYPDGILQACEQLGVAPQATAYVCDASIDLEAARRAAALAVAREMGSPIPRDQAGPGRPGTTRRPAWPYWHYITACYGKGFGRSEAWLGGLPRGAGPDGRACGLGKGPAGRPAPC
jgi:HAD superfamily hydrolase (TIGR01509 family)